MKLARRVLSAVLARRRCSVASRENNFMLVSCECANGTTLSCKLLLHCRLLLHCKLLLQTHALADQVVASAFNDGLLVVCT